MLCCTSKHKRPRLEDDSDDEDAYHMVDKAPVRKGHILTPEIENKLRNYDQMEARIQQLEQLLVNATIKENKSLVDLILHLNENYAKRLADIDKSQKDNAKTVDDILKVIVASTKYYDKRFQDLPEDCQRLCECLEIQLRFEYRSFGKALGISQKILDGIKGSSAMENFWNIIAYRHSVDPIKPQHLYDAFHCVKGTEFDKAGEMPAAHNEIVAAFKTDLYMDVVDAVVVLPYMRCFMYISPEIVQYIISPDNKIARMANLVDVLPTLGKEALQVFVDALYHSGHEVLSSNIKEKAVEREQPLRQEPMPVPLTDADRLMLRRKSRIERAQRVIEEVNELRQMLMQKMQEQLDEPLEENTQF